MRRELAGPAEMAVVHEEDRAGLDAPRLHPSGHAKDLLDTTAAVNVSAKEDHERDRTRDDREDEVVRDISAGQKRQGCQLDESLPGRVRVDAGHPRHPGIESEE
jgi:hypothetical protein